MACIFNSMSTTKWTISTIFVGQLRTHRVRNWTRQDNKHTVWELGPKNATKIKTNPNMLKFNFKCYYYYYYHQNWLISIFLLSLLVRNLKVKKKIINSNLIELRKIENEYKKLLKISQCRAFYYMKRRLKFLFTIKIS